MKKLFLILFISIFLIGLVSAFEFDNVKKYDEKTKTVTIENAFGLGSDIANIKLDTPQDNHVGAGYGMVAQFTITGYFDYDEFLKELKLYDKKNNDAKITRTYDYKYLTTESVKVKDSGINWEILKNGTKVAYTEDKGSHYETKEVWKDLTIQSIKANDKLTIGIFTDVQVGDKVEWIPTLFGVSVDEWATWTADLNVGLVRYFKLDEGSGTVATDSTGQANGAIAGTPTSITGKIGTAYNNTVAGKYFYTKALPSISAFTISGWYNLPITGGIQALISDDGTNDILYVDASGVLYFELSGSAISPKSNGTIVSGAWAHIVFQFENSTNVSKIWLNNTLVYTSNSKKATTTAFNFSFPRFNTQVSNIADDEIGIWNRTLTETEITQLWNGGTGITYASDFAPTITLNEPANLTTVTNPVVLFNVTGNEDVTIQNISLIVNGTYIATNTSPINNVKTGLSYTLPSSGLYNWTGEVCDSLDQCTNASVFYLWYNNSLTASLNSPVNTYNSTSPSVSFQATGSDDTLLQNMSLILNGTYNGTNTSVYNATLTKFVRNIPDGFWNWTVEVCDDNDNCFNATARNITVDTTLPAVAITAPVALQDIHRLGATEQLNWTATDNFISYCWYEYNSINTTVTCSDNTTDVTLTNQITNITFWSNDTSGNYNSASSNFYFKIFEMERVGGTTNYETATNEFYINTTSNSSLTNATFNWNGTAYSTTKTGNNFSTDFQIPVGVQNQEYFWNFTYDGDYIKTNTTNQTISLTLFANCNATYADPFVNFTARDETNLTNLSFKIPTSTFIYYLGNGTINKTLTYIEATEKLNHTFCATPSSQTFKVDSNIQYENTNYPQRIYDPDILSYTNTVTTTVLYLLHSSVGQSVIFQVVNPAEETIEGASVNATRSISGVTTIVGSGSTDSSGAVTFFLDPDFSHTIYASKTGYSTASVTIFPTSTSYTITLGSTTGTTTYDYSKGVNYTITPTGASLTNDTVYNFTLTLGSSFWTVTNFGFNLVNSTGSILATSTATTNGGVTYSSYNTTNLSNIYMNFFYIINSTSSNFTRGWVIYDSGNTGFSISTFFSDLTDTIAEDLFGLDNFGLALILFLLIFVGTGIMASKIGFSNPATIAGTMFFLTLFLNVGLDIIPLGESPLRYFPTVVVGLIFIAILFREVSY